MMMQVATAAMAGLENAEILPVAEGMPLPHRKVIRSWLLPLIHKNTALAIWLIVLDSSLWIGSIFATVYFDQIFLKIFFGLSAGFITGRLFILGHDACHQSFTSHRGLNRLLGRIAFLPSLTPYSLWDVGHNVVHHGQTNLKEFDFVWEPLSKAEYDALPRWRQILERHYRSGFGPAMYYLVEIWWKRLFFPSKKYKPVSRSIFMKDNILVTIFTLMWISLLVLASIATHQSLLLLLLTGFVIPFIAWNGMIGFVVYVHHTHPDIAWYDKKSEWMRAQPFVSTTVHLKFNFYIGSLLHHIMEHTAHHVDMSVPLYNLKAAQSRLEELMPNRIVVQPFSWKWYFDVARICKLYDFDKKAWCDFAGIKLAESNEVILTA
jgi:omega-6 fatty acid desaturase (delta-12 desaturase)